MITLRGLTKRYGPTLAVDDLTLDVAEGRVTGFLGPNGAGKSTTMRMILGLDHPTEGVALIDGKPYAALRQPIREVGALLDAKALHPGRTARKHLLAMALSNGLSGARVDEVLDEVGLSQVADRRAGGFSLGMFQRLGIAGALLGDPPVLIFDEPVNGLDPDGVRWIRDLVRTKAAEGRTIFISSHLMSEMQLTADQLVIIGRGGLIADAPIEDIIARSLPRSVRLRSPDPAGLDRLHDRLVADGVAVARRDGTELAVFGAAPGRIGDLAFELGVRVHELTLVEASLEDAYMELTAGSVEYRAPRTSGGETR